MLTMTGKKPLPVLIIGSGLGGLTLAHSLTKHNIPYRLFERDSQHSQRAQGYRISIGNGGADGLRAALTTDLYDRFERTCAEQHPVVGQVDGRSGRLLRAGILGLLGTGGWGMVWALGTRYIGKRLNTMTWASQSDWFWSWCQCFHFLELRVSGLIGVSRISYSMPEYTACWR
jgi:2-polyprenyl-6-methoxyphenol hydroxylase-like FAD-dependent oxidoreductase